MEFFQDFDKPPTPDDDDDTKPFDESDFGWALGWETAKEIGTVFARYRILPEAGGWWDQRADVRHDLLMFNKGLNWARMQSTGDGGGESIPAPGGASKDWLELM